MDNRSLNGNLEKYKLIYFDLRGRGEIPRLLFHAADVDFEDMRIDNEEEWYNTLRYSKFDFSEIVYISYKNNYGNNDYNNNNGNEKNK